MKRGLTIGLAIAALGIMVSFVPAGSSPREPVTSADAVPAYEIITALREMGLEPRTLPLRRGPYYVLHALDPRGIRMRVVADAHFGDIISVTPARPSHAVNYYRGPRIIEVPQDDAHDEFDSRDPAGRLTDDDDVEPAPPPRRAAPKPQRSSTAPAPAPRWKPSKATAPPPAAPPPAERRAVLSAPPPPPESLSPIYPTPKFESAGKFKPPENAAFPPPPPPGYEPPAVGPRD